MESESTGIIDGLLNRVGVSEKTPCDTFVKGFESIFRLTFVVFFFWLKLIFYAGGIWLLLELFIELFLILLNAADVILVQFPLINLLTALLLWLRSLCTWLCVVFLCVGYPFILVIVSLYLLNDYLEGAPSFFGMCAGASIFYTIIGFLGYKVYYPFLDGTIIDLVHRYGLM